MQKEDVILGYVEAADNEIIETGWVYNGTPTNQAEAVVTRVWTQPVTVAEYRVAGGKFYKPIRALVYDAASAAVIRKLQHELEDTVDYLHDVQAINRKLFAENAELVERVAKAAAQHNEELVAARDKLFAEPQPFDEYGTFITEDAYVRAGVVAETRGIERSTPAQVGLQDQTGDDILADAPGAAAYMRGDSNT